MLFTFKQAFHSGKFVTGFVIFASMLVIVFVYPLLVPAPPLEIIGQGTFFAPGIYVNVYDSIGAPHYTLNLEGADAKRIASKLNDEDRDAIKEWLVAAGVPAAEIDTENTQQLLETWFNTYDQTTLIPGMTNAKRNYYIRLNNSIQNLLATEGAILAAKDPNGALQEAGSVPQTAYVNVWQVPNVRILPLGTDNFGRDVLTELIAAARVSLYIGLVAGFVATSIGLIIGLISGFIGGMVDDSLMFVTNLFTVIPSFVLLILISFSIGQDKRGPFTIAIVIGFTTWVWTARAVRSQVVSLRNRDHVNLSRLSGHSQLRIILRDILPYIASYVMMAFVLQISGAIVAEAGLSLLGLGPRTT
jgi:peptide/nickel transport system permease protein